MTQENTKDNGMKYDAFISYKHGTIDNDVALKLQKALENFRISKSLFGKERKRKISRVFVDKGELASGMGFGEHIREALNNTEWLVVICSKETPSSEWVNLEIDTFLETHDIDHILPVLTEGEPKESFPKQLLGNEQNHYTEAFAADVRGNSINEILKNVKKDAVFRIAAPILGTSFDALKQRKKIYFYQRLFYGMIIVFAAILAFMSYATVQNKRINDQYRKTMVAQAQFLGAKAKQELKDNDPVAAVEMALQVAAVEGLEHQMVPDAEYALTKALNLYSTSDSEAVITGKFEHFDSILDKEYFVDESHNILFSCDNYNIYLWDTENMNLLDTITREQYIKVFDEKNLLKEDGVLIFADNLEICCYDYLEKQYLWKQSVENTKEVVVDVDSEEIFCIAEEKFVTVNRFNGNIIFEKDDPFLGVPRGYGDVLSAISEDGKFLAYNVEESFDGYNDDFDYYEKANDCIVFVDLENYEFSLLPLEFGFTEKMYFAKNNSLVLCMLKGMPTYINSGYEQNHFNQVEIISIDAVSRKMLWENSFSYFSGFGRKVYVTSVDELNERLIAIGNKCVKIDENTGKITQEWEFLDSIVTIWRSEDGAAAITADGNAVILNYGEDSWTHFSVFQYGDELLRCVKNASTYFCAYSEMGIFSETNTIIKFEFGDNDDQYVKIPYEKIKDYASYSQGYCDESYYILVGRNDYDLLMDLIIYDDKSKTAELKKIENNFQCDLNIYTTDCLGTAVFKDKKGLVFEASDWCDNEAHWGKCFAFIDIETGKLEMQYIPIPKGTYSKAVTVVDGSVYVLCSEDYYDEQGNWKEKYKIYLWNLGDESMKLVHEWIDSYHSYSEISMDNKKQNLLLFDYEFLDDGVNTKYVISNIDLSKKSTVFVMEKIIPYDARELIQWSEGGSLWALVCENAIEIYDAKGTLRSSIGYDGTKQSVESYVFTPNEEYMLVITSDGNMHQYRLNDGMLVNTFNFTEELQIDSFYLDEVKWEYIDDTTVAFSCAKGTIILDVSEEMWGIRTYVPDALGFVKTAESGRFYIYDSPEEKFGYFPYYTVEELIESGKKFVSLDSDDMTHQ